MNDTDGDHQRREVRAIMLPIAILGLLGFSGALITAAAINIRGDRHDARLPPAQSQPTVTTGEGQSKVPK
jgi:hypothetical protein